jgi:hypothetical protein
MDLVVVLVPFSNQRRMECASAENTSNRLIKRKSKDCFQPAGHGFVTSKRKYETLCYLMFFSKYSACKSATWRQIRQYQIEGLLLLMLQILQEIPTTGSKHMSISSRRADNESNYWSSFHSSLVWL